MMIARHVRKLAGYIPGEQPKTKNVVKLNTNENAYPPSPKCAQVLKRFDLERLRRYCDPDCTALREALAKLHHTTPDHIFVGNGSDEILALSAKTFVENDESIGSLDPSYSLYKTLAAIRDVEWRGCAIGEKRGTRNKEWRKISLFLLTNPNAPTGEWIEPAAIAAFAKKFKGVVLIDEAYGDFARGNCMKLAIAEDNRNILVMRTFSKSFSLAGLRVGYCVGPKELIDALVKVKDSYNVDAIAQAVALAAVKSIAAAVSVQLVVTNTAVQSVSAVSTVKVVRTVLTVQGYTSVIHSSNVFIAVCAVNCSQRTVGCGCVDFSSTVECKIEIPVCLGIKEAFNHDLVIEVRKRNRYIVPISTVCLDLIRRISVDIDRVQTFAVAYGINTVALVEGVGVVA